MAKIKKIKCGMMIGQLLFLCFPFLLMHAQSGEGARGEKSSPNLVSGYVLREFINSPISGVEIISQHTGEKALSADNGFFTLSVAYPDTLIFQKSGYIHLKMPVLLGKSIKAIMVSKYDLLDSVVITPASSASYISSISRIDLSTTPVNNAQDLLRKVGGLFIAQHQGGGKAEQIFLRGFDNDHGTDIRISADGMPVNMVSHAHGQGYADLHFIIPETVENISFGKGAYYVDKGDFNTSGYVDFNTYKKLPQSMVKLEGGSFHTARLMAMMDLLPKNIQDKSLYVATEYNYTDGFFHIPQNFHRLNLMAKYWQQITPKTSLTASVSTLNSAWNGSGQIPLIAASSLAVNNRYSLKMRNEGVFGSLDSTEGGNTQRTNVILNVTHQIDTTSSLKSTFWFTHYGFELWSNFLFWQDTLNGSAIHQVDNRTMYGMDHHYTKDLPVARGNLKLVAGAYFRMDNIDKLFLGHVVNRYTPTDTLSDGAGTETNIALYGGLQYHIGKFSIHPGVRVDYFNWNYVNILRERDLQQIRPTEGRGMLGAIAARPSYKLNMYFQATNQTQLFLKLGTGFHSNDMRSVLGIGRNDADVRIRGPQFNSGIQYGSYRELLQNALPFFAGADIGLVLRPAKGLFISPVFWGSYLENEFVWSGDSYGVDPVGKTYRLGLDLTVRYQPVSWVYFDLDANFARPRLLTDPETGERAKEGSNYLDLAPLFTSTAGVSVKAPFGLTTSLRYRWMANRPGDQEYHFTIPGYFINDLLVQYQRRHWLVNMSIQNLFNVRWFQASFVTSEMGLKESQIPSGSIAQSSDEASKNQAFIEDGHLTTNGIQTGITDLAVTPGTPIFVKIAFAYTW